MTDDEYWASIMANERAQIAKLTAECNALQTALHAERERHAVMAESYGHPGLAMAIRAQGE